MFVGYIISISVGASLGGVPVPKIIKMPKRSEEHWNPRAIPPSSPSSEPTKVIPLRSQDTDTDAHAITRWVNLGDRVLGNTRKKA
jgi:hypothetical protein